MALIVVVEDDPGTRMLIASVLKKEGHDVLTADNGSQGMAVIRGRRPDLILSDVEMAPMNGFELLAAIRNDPVARGTPVILLTSLHERAHIRIGMTSGADDYLTKPFRASELRDAVLAQLGKRELQNAIQAAALDHAVQKALEAHTHELSRVYERRLAAALDERWSASQGTESDEAIVQGSIVTVAFNNYPVLSERLPVHQLAELVKRFYSGVGDTVYLFGARHLSFLGSGLGAVFVDSNDTNSVAHNLRAVRASFGLSDTARSLRQFSEPWLDEAQVARFGITVAVHDGPMLLATLQDPLHDAASQTLPLGQAATAALQINRHIQKLGWSVGASASFLTSLGQVVRTGRQAELALPGSGQPFPVVELLGLRS